MFIRQFSHFIPSPSKLIYSDCNASLLVVPRLLICKMLNLCYTVGAATLDVLFNTTKSSLFAVGRLCDKTIDSLI